MAARKSTFEEHPVFVRVKDSNTGHEYTTARVAVRDGETVIEKEAVDLAGNPLPGKPHLTRSQERAEASREDQG